MAITRSWSVAKGPLVWPFVFSMTTVDGRIVSRRYRIQFRASFGRSARGKLDRGFTPAMTSVPPSRTAYPRSRRPGSMQRIFLVLICFMAVTFSEIKKERGAGFSDLLVRLAVIEETGAHDHITEPVAVHISRRRHRSNMGRIRGARTLPTSGNR